MSDNPLLVKAPRRVIRVETPSRPDLTLYVRALTGAEFMALGDRINKSQGAVAYTALQLEMFVCNENGDSLLAAGEGATFIDCIEAVEMRRLMEAADKLNALNDKTLEEAEKN